MTHVTPENRSKRLEVAGQVVSCTNCELHKRCKLPVPFYGPTPSKIVVIGEAPGAQEDQAGQPFIGPAGKMIRKHLAAVNIDTEDEVCWINTASCFPHGTPQSEHIEACAGNKTAQIELADPKYILLLGKVALKAQHSELEMKRVRGKAFLVNGRINFPTYHPSAALRNGDYERAMADDLEQFRALLDADSWLSFAPEHCTTCGKWGEWFYEDGLTHCMNHANHEAREWVQKLNSESRHRLRALAEKKDPWMRQMWVVLLEYLRTNDRFFVDEFWTNSNFDRSLGVAALGRMVKRACDEGIIERSTERRPSSINNGEEKPVWTSLVYQSVLT